MEPKKPAACPSCGTRLSPDQDACPNCPWSYREANPEKSLTQTDGFRNLVVPVIIFGGLAYFVWAMASFLWKSTEEGTRDAATGLKKNLAVVVGAAKQQGAPPPGVDSASIQRQVEELAAHPERVGRGGMIAVQGGGGTPAPSDAPPPREKDEGEGGGVVSVMPSTAARDKAVTEWKLRGHVYDLVTLKPVPGVSMIFTDNETNSRAQIMTDSKGLYRVILPPLQGRGYLVAINKAGYQKAYLNPGTEGVAEMPQPKREEMARELATLIAEPASLEPNSEKPLVTDFHLAPK